MVLIVPTFNVSNILLINPLRVALAASAKTRLSSMNEWSAMKKNHLT